MRNPFPESRPQDQSSLSDERAERLRREFDEIDENRDKFLSFEEVHKFLSRRAGKQFDKQLCQELFAKMDKNSDDAITVEEFIKAYVDAEELIKNRIEDLRAQIKESESHLSESQKQLLEAEADEELNEYGIMKGSQLTVQVIEAKNLKTVGITGSSNPYVVLTCDKQKIETAHLSRTQTPHWDEAFTFTIPKGDIDLKAVAQSDGLLRSSDFQGQVSIPLTLVKDQMKHDSWFELHGPKGNEPWQGSLRLGIQWIWSRREYLSAIVKQWEDNINLDYQEIDHLMAQLKKLDEPFGFVDGAQTTVTTKASLQVGAMEMIIDEKIANLAEQAMGSDFNWDAAVLICVGVVIVLSTFSMYIRPDFPNVRTRQTLLGVLGFYFYISKTFTSRNYRYMAYAILVLVGYDLLWLMGMGGDWSSSFTPASPSEDLLRHFSLWLSCFLFLWKFAVLVVFWKQAVEAQKQETKPI